MIDTQTTCKYQPCGRLIVQKPGKGHRKRLYCDYNCKMRDRRAEQERKAREAELVDMRARWTGLAEETQQALEDVLQYSVPLASQVAVATRNEITAAKNGAQARIGTLEEEVRLLKERLDIEQRFRSDVKVRHFKSWLRKQPQSQGSDFAKRFLADTRLPQHASRSLYEAKMKATHDYSTEDIFLFQDAWKTLMLFQS